MKITTAIPDCAAHDSAGEPMKITSAEEPMKITPAIRREVILATGLCSNPECVAHDAVVERIWKYKEDAANDAYQQAEVAAFFGSNPPKYNSYGHAEGGGNRSQ